MKLHHIPQGSEEWLNLRLGKFTGSDAQAVGNNGKGLDTLVYKKAAEILTGQSPDSYTNGDIERGNEMEMSARNLYEIENGVAVEEVGFIELSDNVGCSPDGLVDEDGGVEIKCPNDYKFVQYLHTGKIESKYLWQIQYNLYVSGRKWWDYIVFNQNFEGKAIVKRIERDEKKIEKIKAGLRSGTNKLNTVLNEIRSR